MKKPPLSIQISKFIVTPLDSKGQSKRIKGSLQKDIRRSTWTQLLSFHKPKLKFDLPSFSYRPGWKDVIIAFLFGLLITGHQAHILPDYTALPTGLKVSAIKPLKPLQMPQMAAQAQLASIPVPAPAPVAPEYVAPVAVTGCGSDPAMAFIYQHESGCNTASINASSGACGLGQALPCSKMGCSLSDWACQNAFFVSYAVGRYGSTAAAAAFWVAHSWW